MIDLGNRFRLLVNEVDVVRPGQAAAETAGGARGLAMPARFADAAAAWIYAGGAHHTGFSQASPPKCWRISPKWPASNWSSLTTRPRLREFKKELRHNEVYYALARGFGLLS